jgi:hypothetical protein
MMGTLLAACGMEPLLRVMERQALERAVFRRAADLVAAGWSRGAPARDAAGVAVRPLDPAAAAFCLIGAVRRAEREVGGPRFDLSVAWHWRRRGFRGCPDTWNDAAHRTQAEVVERLLELAGTK